MRPRVDSEFVGKIKKEAESGCFNSDTGLLPRVADLCDDHSILVAALNDALDERGMDSWPQSFLVVCAFRYCLGRMTVAVPETVSFLVENWAGLPAGTRNLIQNELEREFQADDQVRKVETNELPLRKPLGMDCDRREWDKVRALWAR